MHRIRLLTIVLLSARILLGAGGSLVLSPGGVSGSSISLNLSLASAGSQPAGIQWTLTYPSGSVLSVGASSLTAGKTVSCAAGAGTYTCLLVGQNSTLIADGVVAALNVTLAAGIPSATIGLTNTLGATFDGSSLPLTGTGTTITAPPQTGLTPIRVDAGGGAFTDPATGNVWSADTGSAGGNTYTTSSTITDVANPSQAALYQSQRYGNFQYQFAVPSGAYTVNLKFAEVWWTSPGQRIFNVAINGQTVLANFDILAAAGGPLIAVDKAFTVTATSSITIQFTTVVDNASINSIEILPGSAPVTASITPATVTLTASQTQPFTATVTNATNTVVTWNLSPAIGAGSISVSGNTATYTAPSSITASQTVTLTATSAADTTKSASAQITLSPASTSTAIHVNSGGGTFTDPATGYVWSADTGFSGGNIFSTTSTVRDTANSSQAPLYQTERYGNFSYTFTVPSGTYTVTLKFAELYWTSTGQRVFNVAINGQTVLSNFDIVAAAGGPLVAIDRSFTVGPTSSITIQFTTVVDNAKVDAIQIQ